MELCKLVEMNNRQFYNTWNAFMGEMATVGYTISRPLKMRVVRRVSLIKNSVYS